MRWQKPRRYILTMPDRPKKFRGPWMPEPGRRKDTRPSAAQRGYDERWKKASRHYRNIPGNQTCVYCAMQGKVRPATCVDHIIPHKGNEVLRMDVNNWAASCKQCNDRKGDKSLDTFLGMIGVSK